jgi:hypothetical protein
MLKNVMGKTVNNTKESKIKKMIIKKIRVKIN